VIDGPLPIGELVGAVFAAGYGVVEIIGLYKEWKRLTK